MCFCNNTAEEGYKYRETHNSKTQLTRSKIKVSEAVLF